MSRRLNVVATDLLFRRVYPSIHREDLEVLSAISQHPTIRHAVHKVVHTGGYFGSTLPVSALREAEAVQLAYSRRFQEQEETRKNKRDLAIITDALANIPNVRRIIVNRYPGETKTGPLARSLPESEYGPDVWPLRMDEGPHKDRSFDYGFQVMCKAMSMSGREIETFVTPGPDQRFLKDGLLPTSFVCSPGDLSLVCNAFSHMRKIVISIMPTFQLDVVMEGNIARVLASATQLEELQLRYHFGSAIGTDPLPVAEVLGTHTWRRLRTLRLSDTIVRMADLVEFIGRHRITLKKLQLFNMRLRDGTWQEAAQELRRLGMVGLSSVEVTGLYEGGSQQANESEFAQRVLGQKDD
ncbi:hypothetical protein GGR52DRAFT_518848 [Hypoxylon sp. FL1284]|nr:hypothetical protein GGR52DRAFT_518848 [Hypoxylon sp. FL1284]